MNDKADNNDGSQSKSDKLGGGFKRRKRQRPPQPEQVAKQEVAKPVEAASTKPDTPEPSPQQPSVRIEPNQHHHECTSQPVLGPDNAVLVLHTGKQAGMRIELNQPCTVLGRFMNRGQLNPQQEKQTPCPHFVNLTDANDPETLDISRLHAELHWQSGELLLTDLGSMHGTYVNNNLISGYAKPEFASSDRLRSQSIRLEAGNLIRLAHYTFEVQIQGV